MFSRLAPAVLLLLAVNGFAADWPQWRGPTRDGVMPAAEPPLTALPTEPRVLWEVPISEGFASPIVAQGRVFCLDTEEQQEIARAYDAETGKELWNRPLFSAHRDGFGIGPRTTPVADGERVFFQSAKGELQCLNAKTGELLWRKNFVDDFGAVYIGEKGKASGGSRHGATAAPLIDGERVILSAGNPEGATFVACEMNTGKVLWKTGSDQSGYASPIIAEIAGARQFISFTADSVTGVNPEDGAVLWRHPVKTALGRHVTAPIVFKDLVIVSSHQVGLIAVRVERDGSGFRATEAWINKEAAINFSNPVATGGHLYGIGPAKNVICVSLRDGKMAWAQQGLITTSADRAVAGFLVSGQNVLMLTDSGQLVLFAAEPAAYRQLGQVQVCGFNWCNPAFADGRLYLRDQRDNGRGRLMSIALR